MTKTLIMTCDVSRMSKDEIECLRVALRSQAEGHPEDEDPDAREVQFEVIDGTYVPYKEACQVVNVLHEQLDEASSQIHTLKVEKFNLECKVEMLESQPSRGEIVRDTILSIIK